MEINISRIASLLINFFTDNPVLNYESVAGVDKGLFAAFFQKLLSQGIYWPPSQFEAAVLSLAYSDEDIELTITAIEKALNSI